MTKRQFSEGAFLFASNIEFVKRWRSGRRSRLLVESVKGEAFLNFLDLTAKCMVSARYVALTI